MPAMRAQASAIYIGVITIVASIGPVIVSSPLTTASGTALEQHPVSMKTPSPLAVVFPLLHRASASQ